MPTLDTKYIALLKQLISTPSFSREEDKTAHILQNFIETEGYKTERLANNVWVWAEQPKPELPTILLNSHHDTVRPNASWERDPFQAVAEDGRLYGLGSNDAGGALICLLAAFMGLAQQKERFYNLVFLASAEEEISGKNGVELALTKLGKIDFAIVGEPTGMHMAVAEKGLLVIDAIAHGKAGHAAREEGNNAIYMAMRDIERIRRYRFPQTSALLGEVKMTVTQINAGTQHNVVPDECHFVIDVRTNEYYKNEEIFQMLKSQLQSSLKARSFRLNSSSITTLHPIVKRGQALGRQSYGSPTLSDQALMPFSTLKMGPGESARSHTADEFILIGELEQGYRLYLEMLQGQRLSLKPTLEIKSIG